MKQNISKWFEIQLFLELEPSLLKATTNRALKLMIGFYSSKFPSIDKIIV